MEIFIDSSKVEEIKNWVSMGIVHGITTNPSIMKRDGKKSIYQAYQEITKVTGDRPLSLEVISDNTEEVIKQGVELASWGKNVVVKVPIIARDGSPMLEAINTLSKKGIRINCTAILNFGQCVLATMAGAAYLSIFVGRVCDEGNDAEIIIRKTREWLDRGWYKSKILAASIRGVPDLQLSAWAGSHIITTPPEMLSKFVDHKYSRETVNIFLKDAQNANILLKTPEEEKATSAQQKPAKSKSAIA